MKRAIPTLFTCFALAACAQPMGPTSLHEASTRATTATRQADAPPPTTATLSFNADWSIQQSGSLTSGGKAIIHYDLARLTTCRASYMQFPAWDVLANWNADGGVDFNRSVTTETNSTTRVGTDITIDVPPGRTLNLWFYDSDEYGCQSWDSNYGNNYRFLIEPGPPTIRFSWPGLDPTVIDTLRAGGPILIDYDIRRLAECRAGEEGPAWDVIAFYSFDGAPAQSQSLTTITTSGRVQTSMTLMAPAGAQTIAIWFQNENSDGTCSAWDSRYGANYLFNLQ